MTPYPWMLAAALWLGCAANAQADRKDLVARREASQLVRGSVEVDAQGAVTQFTLKGRDKLPESVTQLLDRTIPRWRFEPTQVDGKPTAARSDMSMRVVLKPLASGGFELGLRGISFDSAPTRNSDRPVSSRLQPPRYPATAMMLGGEASVYVVVKVGPDGRVEDAIDEQINITGYYDSRNTDELRKQFARVALQGARNWSFVPPSTGEQAGKPYWSVRVPVLFRLGEGLPDLEGKWEIYEPGPVREVPWEAREDTPVAFSPDALPPGIAYTTSGLRLVSAKP